MNRLFFEEAIRQLESIKHRLILINLERHGTLPETKEVDPGPEPSNLEVQSRVINNLIQDIADAVNYLFQSHHITEETPIAHAR